MVLWETERISMWWDIIGRKYPYNSPNRCAWIFFRELRMFNVAPISFIWQIGTLLTFGLFFSSLISIFSTRLSLFSPSSKKKGSGYALWSPECWTIRAMDAWFFFFFYQLLARFVVQNPKKSLCLEKQSSNDSFTFSGGFGAWRQSVCCHNSYRQLHRR